MESNSTFQLHESKPKPPSKRHDVLQRLIAAASKAIDPQLDAFALRLSAGMLAASSNATDAKEANLCFNAGNLLHQNAYPFYHLASSGIRTALQNSVDGVNSLVHQSPDVHASKLTLVAFSEMENRLLLDRAARPFEIVSADLLAVLNLRLAALLGRDELFTPENPFRPAVLISAFDQVWRDFDPDKESHHLLLRQIEAGVFIDLNSVLQVVNQTCADAGVLPNLAETYHIRKSPGNRNAAREALPDPVIMQQLRSLMSPQASPTRHTDEPRGPPHGGAPVCENTSAGFATRHAFGPPADTTVIAPALSRYLGELQRRGASAEPAGMHRRSLYRLSEMQAELPRGALSRADETTVDVMTRIFDAVFSDPHIPEELKNLIGYLQVPVLKAALLDKEFFFEELHPARRLIGLLTRSSLGWDASRGQDDPLYQAIANCVDRVQSFDTEIALFDEVVNNLETFFREEERQSASQLATPITRAIRQENLREATRCAATDVATRVATGEVAAFVEVFLESRWVPVLTLAYSVRDAKPQVLENAIKTMDDLIWSVQPKITVQQRKELVAKLPALLTTLNKWLNMLKWDHADRLQFFADLAECHASIVRAPLELSPQRQMELAVEAAQKAAERRLEKRAAQAPEAPPDPFILQVEALERGTWFAFLQTDGSTRRVRLAWISPLKSLFIFTAVHREEAFSIAADRLAGHFREQRVSIVETDSFVTRAVVEVLASQTEKVAAAESV